MFQRFFSTAFLLLFISSILAAQVPQLVQDFTPGGDGSVDDFNYQGIVYDGSLLMPLSSPSTGLELAKITGNSITIVKDINVGDQESDPRSFTEFNGKVYFSANDGTGGTALWVTDGTEAGTEKVFPTGTPSASLSRLVVSASGNLYFSYDNILYRTADGTNFQNITEGANLFISGRQASPVYTTYLDEIAFLYQRGNNWELYAVEGDSAAFKGMIESTSRFSTAFGLTDLDGALMFSTQSSFDADFEDNYIYRPTTGVIETFSIDGGLAARINPLSTKSALCWKVSSGFYNVSGATPTIEKVVSESEASYTQGATMKVAVHNDKYAFISSGGVFSDDFLIFTDGTEAGTRQVKELEPQQTDFISFGKYSLYGEGVSNNFRPKLTLVDMETGDATTVYDFDPLRSTEIRSVRPIGATGGVLYFASKLDAAVGAEIFSIDLDVATGVQSPILLDLELLTNNGQYFLKADQDLQATVSQFNTAGVHLSSQEIQLNSWQPIVDYKGVVILNVEIEGRQKSFTVAQIR